MPKPAEVLDEQASEAPIELDADGNPIVPETETEAEGEESAEESAEEPEEKPRRKEREAPPDEGFNPEKL